MIKSENNSIHKKNLHLRFNMLVLNQSYESDVHIKSISH